MRAREADVRNLLMILMLGATFALTACRTDDGPFRKTTVPEPGPTGLDEQQFDDIPVPKGYTLLPRRSFSHRSGGLRMGQFVYEGFRLSPRAILRHYEREMVRPLYGWTLTDIDREAGTAAFEKSGDRARVQCETKGESTRVTIDVNYEDSGPGTDS